MKRGFFTAFITMFCLTNSWATLPNVTIGDQIIDLEQEFGNEGVELNGQLTGNHIVIDSKDINVEANGLFVKTADTVYLFRESENSAFIINKENIDIIIDNNHNSFSLNDVEEIYSINESIDYTSAKTITASLGLGWNLGNQMDSHDGNVSSEEGWGNPKATQALFDKLKECGFKSVRIPITWVGHIGEAPNYEVDKDWLDRVEELVNYAHNAGLIAIINVHHDGVNNAGTIGWLNFKAAISSEETNKAITEKFAGLWRSIATRFKDYDDFLIFESCNEVHDGSWGWGANQSDGGKQYSVLNGWNQAFVDAVRSTGGRNLSRYLGVPGIAASCGDPNLKGIKVPTDIVANHIMISIHYYDPSAYAIENQFEYWGTSVPANDPKSCTRKNMNVNYDVNENSSDYTLGNIYNLFIAKNIPAYIGEFGSVRRRTDKAEAFREYYLEYNCRLAHFKDLPIFYWDNGVKGYGRESFGLLDHATGEYLNDGEELISVMANAYYSDDKKYTLNSIKNNAPIIINLTNNAGGEATASDEIFKRGESKSFTFTPNEGMQIADVMVDGKSVGAVSEYTFDDLKTSHTISVSFQKITSIASFTNEVVVKTDEHNITIENADNQLIKVFDIEGRCIYEGSDSSIETASGVHSVIVGNQVFKVLVK